MFYAWRVETPVYPSMVAPPHFCPSPSLSCHWAGDPAPRRPLLDVLLAPTSVSRPYRRREQVMQEIEETLIPPEVDPKVGRSRLSSHASSGTSKAVYTTGRTLVPLTGPTW